MKGYYILKVHCTIRILKKEKTKIYCGLFFILCCYGFKKNKIVFTVTSNNFFFSCNNHKRSRMFL